MARQVISRNEAIDLIRNSGGKFFTATVNLRGSEKTKDINCRIGVKKGVKGTGQPAKEKDKKHNLITVYKSGGGTGNKWRSLAIEGLRQLVIDGKVYVIR